MIRDPYIILGVRPGAPDEEIKKAYRKLSRMFHPDANINKSPMERARSEEKFKEVQEAYNQIMKDREMGIGAEAYGRYNNRNTGGYNGGFSGGYTGGYEGGYNGGFSGGNTGGYNGGYTGRGDDNNSYNQDSMQLQAAANYLNAGYYREALNVLGGIQDRTARWYYYSAVANAGLGNNVNAINLARQALSMDPGNREYADFVSRLESGSQWYTRTGREYGRPNMNAGKMCLNCIIANIVCNCCCRPMQY